MSGGSGFRPPATLRGAGDLRAQTERLIRELQSAVSSDRANLDNYLPLAGGSMSGILDFNSVPDSASRPLIDFTYGYSIYSDNTGSGSANSRMWINTPSNGDFYLGPRSGSDYLALSNIRSSDHRILSSSGIVLRIVGGTVRILDGSASAPSLAIQSDTNVGLYLATTDQLGISAGGVEGARFASNNSYLTGARNNTTASAANTLIQAADGRIYRSTSALKYKERVAKADYLADIELVPTKHWRVDDKAWRYGLIADWLADQDPLLGEWSEGELENYDTRAVIAVLVAKVNRLEEQCRK